MSVSIRAAIAAAIATLACAGYAHAQVPLEAYGALPAVEHIETSPSGDRLALVTVAGEDRILAVLDPRAGTLLGRVEVGLAKVRDVTWIGEGEV